MQPVNRENDVTVGIKSVGVGSLTAVSTFALSRLAKASRSQSLLLSGAVGVLSSAAYWWMKPKFSLVKWLINYSEQLDNHSERLDQLEASLKELKGQVREGNIRREEQIIESYQHYCDLHQNQQTEPALQYMTVSERNQVAMEWREYYKSYSDSRPGEQSVLKKAAFDKLTDHPEEVVVLLWLAKAFSQATFFCKELFEKESCLPDPFRQFLNMHVFEEKIVPEKIVESWRFLIAFYLMDREECYLFLQELDSQPSSLSGEDKQTIFDAAINLGMAVRAVGTLSEKVSPAAQKYVLFYMLAKRKKDDSVIWAIQEAVIERILRRSSASISQLLALSTCLGDLSAHAYTIFQLQKVALHPTRLHFFIQVDASSVEFSSPFQSLTQDALLAILQFVPLCDHLSWCLVSKACSGVGRSQRYWKIRCEADFQVDQPGSENAWSQTYQDHYYLYRWIPAQFKKSWQDKHEKYTCLSLNQRQLETVLPAESVSKYADLKSSDITTNEPWSWWIMFQRNQEELLKVFHTILFRFVPSEKEKTSFILNWSDEYIYGASLLCVHEDSLEKVLQEMNQALLCKRERATLWSEDQQKEVSENLSSMTKGLLRRFGMKTINPILTRLGLEECLKHFRAFEN